MQPERTPEWLEGKLVESCGLLEEAAREHQGICSALGLDPDELEPGEAAEVAARIVEAHDGTERLCSLLLELLQLREVEIHLLRRISRDSEQGAKMACATLREAMEVVDVDPDGETSVADFLRRLHDLWAEDGAAPTMAEPIEIARPA